MESLLQKIASEATKRNAAERMERIRRLSVFSPLKIGEIVAETKAKPSADLPLWYRLKREILSLKVGSTVQLDMKHWREIGTAMDDIFENPDKRKEFKLRFVRQDGKAHSVKINRIAG